MKIIARLYCDYEEKFGIPRQSGMVENVIGRIVFEKEYRNPDALRGIEDYSYLWLIWEFSKAKTDKWSPTVRPPRLGGNKRMGVFATRSPFRPNPIGLSSVKLERVDLHTAEGPVIFVSGIDLMNGTPIYDIKPYLPYADSHSGKGGFGESMVGDRLRVIVEDELITKIDEDKRQGLIESLSLDPRPAYQRDSERVYKITFGKWNVHFCVDGKVLKIIEIETMNGEKYE